MITPELLFLETKWAAVGSYGVTAQLWSGGMVIATYGKGTYVDTGYAWFRQLPAGIPGPFRIFANLISLPQAK